VQPGKTPRNTGPDRDVRRESCGHRPKIRYGRGRWTGNKIEAFIDLCRPYGVKSIVRTGTVAMARQARIKTEE